jgi:hypothetical protein
MRKNLALAFAALFVLGTALPSYAYVLLSPRRTWKGGKVTVSVNTTGNSTITDASKGVNAVKNSIGAWSGVVTGATTGAKAVRGDGKPVIELHTNGKVCTGSCLAATLTGYYHTEGSATYIDDADVYTNQRYSYTSTSEADGCSGEFYIEGIMVHEVGHVIGLGHSNVAGATMYPSVGYCNNDPASLAADDTAGKNDLY